MNGNSGGLLQGRFYQMAYVTNDFDRAMAEFGEKAGVARFRQTRDAEFEVKPGQMATAHVALAYAGGVQIEIIEPVGGRDQVYRQILVGSEYQCHFHHEGHVLDTLEEFDATMARATSLGFSIDIESRSPMYTYFYADTRTFLGHYSEFFFFSEEAKKYFQKTVPVN